MQKTPRNLTRLFSTALFLLLLSSTALAAWTYSESGGTITDGNWTIPLGELKNGGLVLQKPKAGTGALDLSTVEADTGLVIKEVGKSSMAGYKGLVSIILPETVTVINDSAFNSCSTLVSIQLPAGLERIEWGAFRYCSSLETVTPFLPARMTSLSSSVFSDCPKLTGSLVLDGTRLSSLGDGIFSYSAITSAALSNIPKVGNRTFDSCKELETVTLSEGLISIGEGAFTKCGKLKSIVPFLPDSVATVGGGAFAECKALKIPLSAANLQAIPGRTFQRAGIVSADLPAVHAIEASGFEGASSLVSVRIPAIERISGWGAFYGCSSLTNITPFFADTLRELGSSVFSGCPKLGGDLVLANPAMTNFPGSTFQGTQITSARLPHSRKIGGYLFASCKLLEAVELGPETTTLEERAFNGCSSLTNITPFLPDSVEKMGGQLFEGCGKLTGDLSLNNAAIVNLPNSTFKGTKITSGRFPHVRTIGASCFEGCSLLGAVYLPSLVRIDGWGTFWQCGSLTNVTPFFADSLEALGSQSFYGCPKLAGDLVLRNEKMTNIISQTFPSTRITSAELTPLRTIGDGAFRDCKELGRVTFSGDLEKIGGGAFSGCSSLTNVTPFLPDSVSYLGGSAFAKCTKLAGDLAIRNEACTNIYGQTFQSTRISSADLPHVHIVGASAFDGCGRLSKVSLGRLPFQSLGWGSFINTAAPTDFFFPDKAIASRKNEQTFSNGRTRNRLYGSLRMDPEGWLLLAEDLTDADRAEKDFPGPKTFGVYLSGGTRHWLIDWRSPYEPKGTVLLLR